MKPIEKINRKGYIVEIYPNAVAAGKANNFSAQSILNRCHGIVKKPFEADGHNYQFKEEEV